MKDPSPLVNSPLRLGSKRTIGNDAKLMQADNRCVVRSKPFRTFKLRGFGKGSTCDLDLVFECRHFSASKSARLPACVPKASREALRGSVMRPASTSHCQPARSAQR